MPELSAPVVKLVRRTTEPVAAQTLRSTAAAVIAYVVAVWTLPLPAPLTAPLTALLVVQVTLYATLTTGIRRVNSVVVGVLIAIGFSALVGLTWWSLGLTIFSSLIIGRMVRVDEFVPEVAISAMLVLGVSQIAYTAWDRVLETLIGAGVGLLFNLLFAPPVWVQTAGASIDTLAREMGRMFRAMGEETGGHISVPQAAARLHDARRLDHDIVAVDASLRQAEESLMLNPRVRQGLLYRIVLRTGLDTLEICAVVLRVLARTLTDLAKARTEESLFPEDVALSLRELFAQMAEAIESFSTLITTPVSANAEEAESRLAAALVSSRAARDVVADLLLEDVQEHPREWQLHGALLAEVDRILDELDIDKRAERLGHELDRHSAEMHERHPRLAALRRRLVGSREAEPSAPVR
ncbi:aromatic acid exporter family protein [Streptomyces sp. NBC_01724]|uniref:FUSC family protein n=1 Tax=unclassified Streptomyces TaxID=2593676 RepID=UPI0028C40B02|nr:MULTISPECIES: aromatic acid exporter family protein [unclassified Streptomyces]WTE55745.1 aromatic acid exporter family protein [Streptomyces sp. NBC_01620]WTE63812.1 aromatic acid exporter family protein [Streptomyces sp. NBC_01617]WTI91097.1 aromatic acid exporter family protein [Streptomyces sp. NBC_00724]WNO68720.1 aromatic acid exporter family protein [Streptomyces sp. AM2-3-1]WSC73366.1 aromatic acid exporter family protein [Streptomyces sp. NBC_01760]